MSRGFVREGDQEEDPIIPDRAPLPEGLINHVTALGLELLNQERDSLEEQKLALQATDAEKHRVEIRVIDIKLDQLAERINTAHVAEPSPESESEVRFGATVSYRIAGNLNLVTFQIVGVDEADVKAAKIAFTSPIAKALIGMKVGEEKEFALGSENRKVSVVSIQYS
jgi:transcription elongation factor GreB